MKVPRRPVILSIPAHLFVDEMARRRAIGTAIAPTALNLTGLAKPSGMPGAALRFRPTKV